VIVKVLPPPSRSNVHPDNMPEVIFICSAR
jgi:hypothetical protein